MTSSMSSKTIILADYLSDVWLRMIRRNGAVAEEAARKIRAGEYGFDDYLQSVAYLVDGNLLEGLDVAQTVVAGPGFKLASNVRRSACYPLDDSDSQYRVKLTSPLTRGFGDELPERRITFESVEGSEATHCPTGILAKGAEQFRLVVDRTNLQSGSYVAKVEVTPVAAELAVDGKIPERDVTIEL